MPWSVFPRRRGRSPSARWRKGWRRKISCWTSLQSQVKNDSLLGPDITNEGVRQDGAQDGGDVGQHGEPVEQDGGVRLREPDDSVDEQHQNGYKNISPLPSDWQVAPLIP